MPTTRSTGLLADYRGELDAGRRARATCERIQRVLAEEVPALYIQTPVMVYLADKALQGFSLYPVDVYEFSRRGRSEHRVVCARAVTARSMLRAVAQRIGAALAVLTVVSVAVFLALRVLPGNPATLVLGLEATPERVAALSAAMGLDDPLPEQYARVGRRGAFGRLGHLAHVRGCRCSRSSRGALPATLALAAYAMALALLVSVPLGCPVGPAPRLGRDDVVARTVMQLGAAAPAFWLAILLMLLFAGRLGWFPVSGFTPFSEGVGPALRSLTLPAVALAAGECGVLIRTVRSSAMSALARDCMLSARVKGLSRSRTVALYVLRSALVAPLTVAGMQLSKLVGGTAVVESVFALPGLGRLLLTAVEQRDLELVQGIVLLVTAAVVLVTLVDGPARHGGRASGPPGRGRGRRRGAVRERLAAGAPSAQIPASGSAGDGAPVRVAGSVRRSHGARLGRGGRNPVRHRCARVPGLARMDALRPRRRWTIADAVRRPEPGAPVRLRPVRARHPLPHRWPPPSRRCSWGWARSRSARSSVHRGSAPFAGMGGPRGVRAAFMRVVEGLMAFPGILLAMVLVLALGRGLASALAAIAVFMVPTFARLTCQTTLEVRGAPCTCKRRAQLRLHGGRTGARATCCPTSHARARDAVHGERRFGDAARGGAELSGARRAAADGELGLRCCPRRFPTC